MREDLHQTQTHTSALICCALCTYSVESTRLWDTSCQCSSRDSARRSSSSGPRGLAHHAAFLSFAAKQPQPKLSCVLVAHKLFCLQLLRYTAQHKQVHAKICWLHGWRVPTFEIVPKCGAPRSANCIPEQTLSFSCLCNMSNSTLHTSAKIEKSNLPRTYGEEMDFHVVVLHCVGAQS